jgi:hypothetical protein
MSGKKSSQEKAQSAVAKPNTQKSISRSAADADSAINELKTLSSSLSKEISALTKLVNSKSASNEKLSNQIQKLTALHNNLVIQEAENAKEYDIAINKSIEDQKQNTSSFEKLIPEISRRIDESGKKTEILDLENSQLREKLLAAVEEYERRREKLERDMEIIHQHSTTNKKQTTDTETAKDNTDEPRVVELPDEDEPDKESLSEAEADSTEPEQLQDEDEIVTTTAYAKAESNKIIFATTQKELFEKELELRKDIIRRNDELQAIQKKLSIASDEFQIIQSELENTVSKITQLNNDKNNDEIRLLQLSKSVAASSSSPSSSSLSTSVPTQKEKDELEKYVKLYNALQKAVSELE